ncbi:CD63 antigen-like [Styela clava]
MDCGMKLIKYLLFAFNLVFFIIALVLIGVGAAVEIKYRDLVQITGSTISSAPILLICVGVFIMIIAFFGCCGAYKENYCMVTTFMVSLLVIFILEMSAGIAAFALRNRIEIWIKKSVQDAISKYTPKMKPVFGVVQEKFKCCGAVSSVDWETSTGFQAEAKARMTQAGISSNNGTKIVPDSCCITPKKDCGLKSGHLIYTGAKNGCVEKIEAFIKRNAGVIGGVGIGIAFIQIVGIIFACCLMRTIKKEYEHVA